MQLVSVGGYFLKYFFIKNRIMKNLSNENSEDIERLRMENELKKMKLMLEHGAVFSEPTGENHLDPGLENAFLNSVEEFEKNYQSADSIALYDFIGRPEYTFTHMIPDSQISEHLAQITNILSENEIRLDTICQVDDREVYRFITEELFLHEMENMRIKGMMHCFIYEEFHPNHEYDIRQHCTDGIRSFLNKKSDYYTTFFTKEAENDPWLKSFRDSFKSFSIKHFDILDLTFDEENATVVFTIDFTATIDGSGEKQHYSGKGSMELVYRYDFWCIQKIIFPEVLN